MTNKSITKCRLCRRLAMSSEIVSLDFGGTLAYETKEEHIVYYDAFGKLGFKLDIDDLQLALKHAKAWWKQEKKQGKIWNEHMTVKYADRILSYLKINGTMNLAKRVAELWREIAEYKAYDDVEPTILALRKEGYRLIVISNVSSVMNLSKFLSKVNLNSYFDLLVGSGSIGIEKPNRGIFLWASNSLRVDPSQIIHVGDDYEADYLGAIEAGLKAALIDRNNANANINAIRIRSLTELPQLIKRT